MRRPLVFIGLAVFAGAVLATTVFRNDIASARSAAQTVTIDNTAANPVPVREQGPPPPLWQGTPYIDTRVIFGSGCEALETIPAGTVLFVQRAIVNFNVAPGQTGSSAIRLTPLGGSSQASIDIPSHPSAPAQQVAGIYDRYMGVIEVGQPSSTTPQGCFFAGSEDVLRGTITVMGFLLPAS